MTRSEVFTQLNDIFNDTLDQEDIRLNEHTTAGDVKDWDSLTNMQLIAAIERQFAIRFKTSEISEMQNVGELVDLILQKINRHAV